MIINDGVSFCCARCANELLDFWNKHNEGRLEPYLIAPFSITVVAETKKEFEKIVLPQLIAKIREKKRNIYIPKKDIAFAARKLIKRKDIV